MKNRMLAVGALFVLAALIGWRVVSNSDAERAQESSEDVIPANPRLVSLAPSLTEVVCALGLGESLVGVTEYCRFPPEARTKPRVGGYVGPNFEAVLACKPDLVLTLPEHLKDLAKMTALGLRHRTLEHRRVAGILDSITQIGAWCGAKVRAKALREDIEARLAALKAPAGDRARARVLISIGRQMQQGPRGSVTVCGPNTLYDEYLALAGGVNACTVDLPYPMLSGEGVLALQPDLIVDLVPDLEAAGGDIEGIRAEWASIPGLKAVSEGHVVVLSGDHVLIPGPRFVLVVEAIAQALRAVTGERDGG